MLLDNGHADPQTPCEWQEVADLANFYLVLAAYGLVEETFQVNKERCLAMLYQAQERGYVPCRPEEVLKKVTG